MRLGVALTTMLLASSALAEDVALVCYDYGCAREDLVVFADYRLNWARNLLAAARGPAQEREYLALVIGRMYAWAALQSPIAADRGGNFADDGREGSMDCIDHSTTTTRFLNLLADKGWLRFHRVLAPDWRRYRLIGQHFAAMIEEKNGGGRYAVDSWLVDNGQPAVILPLEQWLAGGGPDVE